MIVRCAYDHDVVIHFNNKKGMTKKVKLADGTFTTLTYPSSKNYFLRNGHGRIDIVKHKIVDHKVVER